MWRGDMWPPTNYLVSLDLQHGKLEVSYPTDDSVSLQTRFERTFTVRLPGQSGAVTVRCDGEGVPAIGTKQSPAEVAFAAAPGKTYVIKRK